MRNPSNLPKAKSGSKTNNSAFQKETNEKTQWDGDWFNREMNVYDKKGMEGDFLLWTEF